MIVTISAEAERDLEELGDYIARDNCDRAISYISELRTKCLSLADLPQGFPLVPRYETKGIRRRVDGSHLIFYRVELEEIVVLHVVHGAQSYGEILFPS